MMNVWEMIRSMFTPMRLAVSASWATALMPLPSRVTATTRSRVTSITMVTMAMTT